MPQNQSTHASNRRLSAALLRSDKTVTRHEATKNAVSEYTRFTLRQSRGLKGYVDTVKVTDNAVMPITPVHAADFTPDSEDFLVVTVRLLTYGEGAIQHPYFQNRKSYTEAVTEFILAVRDLSKGEVYVCHRQSNDHIVRTQPDKVDELLSPHGKTKDVIAKVVAHIIAANNEINNGGIKAYDSRESVRAGKLTPYGQFLKDSGKPDKAMSDLAKNGAVTKAKA